MSVTQSQAKSSAGTIGIATAVVLLVILALAYYFGGYVAGRMSRFDGARQGALVWIIGLLVTIAAAVVGAVFGTQYNVLDRVNLPRLPISTDQAGLGGIITVVAVLVVTLLAAILGGKIGNHYHTRVDKAALR
jgi:heme/copper-type cytochrome/quinol oxidase subunit 1